MPNLSLFEIGMIGFLAQLIDGALGMGYGVTASGLLISFGVFPAMASACIHASEIFVTFFSGLAHFKFGNVRKELLRPLILFGIAGGVLGACGLVKLPARPVKFIVGAILFAMGMIIIYKFYFVYAKKQKGINGYPTHKLRLLGFFAAFIDAIGGGGWGPICTPTLIINGTEPHKAIGSVDLAEFFVTLGISATFYLLIGFDNFRWDIVFALLIGGISAAPLAAYACKRLPRRLLGGLVGVLVVILSLLIFVRK